MQIKLICILIILVFSFSSFAQVKIHGNVKDSSGKYVAYATVIILNADQGTTLYFSMVDKNGAYAIEIPAEQKNLEALTIQVTSVGYQKVTKGFFEGVTEYNFTLQEEVKDLEPVIIKGERAKVQLRGDTLSYDAKAFSSVNDRVIEDVIKKLPGVEVADDGRISYNGKSITNLYIDGDNLLDDKYAIGTKNIPNKIVDKIQVFQNHQPIKALAGKSISDQIDMNITLTDSAKIKPINTAMVGAGPTGNFDGTINSMLFNKKYKALNYFKMNNTGVELSNEITSFNLSDLMNRLDIMRPDNLLSLGTTGTPTLPKYRYLFNNTGMVNTNNLFNLKNDVQLKTNIYYLYDRQQQDYRSQTTVTLPGNTISYTENQNSNSRPNQFHAQANIAINKENYYLNNTLIADFNHQSSKSFMNTNGNAFDQQLKDNLQNFSNELKYIGTVRNNRAFEFYNYINLVREPQRLIISPGLNADYFNSGVPFQELSQTTNIPSFFTNTYVSFRKASIKFKQSYKVGFNSQSQNLQSILSKAENLTPFTTVLDSGINDLHWKRYKLFMESDYTWISNRITLNFSLPLALQHIDYSDNSFKKNDVRNDLIFNPQIDMKYKSGLENHISSGYRYNTEFGSIGDLFNGYILKNYRTLYFNDAPILINNVHTASLGYFYQKSIKVLFANLNVAYTIRSANNIAANIINNNFQKQISIPLDNNSKSLTLYGSISKYLFPIKTTLTLNANWMKSKTNQIQNSQLLPFNNYITRISARANSQVNDWFSFDYSINYSHFKSSRLENAFVNIAPSEINQIQQKATLNFQLSPVINFNTTGEQFYSQQSFSKNSNIYFVDMMMKYSMKKYHTDLELGIQNIANIKQFNATSVNTNSTIINQYTIRGRTALLKLFFSF